MAKEIKKILYKVLPFVLCICIVSGAVAPAYAASTNADSAASKLFDLYWSTSSNPSGQNGTWYGVVRILLKDIYDRLESVWSDQRNLWTYNSTSYSLWNFSNNSNLSQSYYISNGAGPVSWLLNSMANLSQNTGYVANQFYNSNSNFNKAMSAMVSLNSNFQDYTSVLNTIKSNTDNLSGIKTDTANLSGIKTDTANLSGIKTDTANLSGIKTDTANLSGIKIDTANLSGIKTDLETFTSDYNNINWIESSFTNFYYSTDDINTSVLPAISTKSGYFVFNTSSYNGLIKLRVPITSNSPIENQLIFKVGYLYNNVFNEIPDAVICLSSDYLYSDFIINIPLEYAVNNTYPLALYFDHYGTNRIFYIRSITPYIYTLSNNSNDYYSVNTHLNEYNILRLIRQAKEIFFDDKTIAAKRANQAQEDSVLTNFTGSGVASASVSDFGAVKDSMVDLKAGLSGGASSSDTFSFLNGDSNAWDWFTQDTANDLDRTQRSNTRLFRSSSDVAYDTPLLDSYYNSVLSILGGEE